MIVPIEHFRKHLEKLHPLFSPRATTGVVRIGNISTIKLGRNRLAVNATELKRTISEINCHFRTESLPRSISNGRVMAPIGGNSGEIGSQGGSHCRVSDSAGTTTVTN